MKVSFEEKLSNNVKIFEFKLKVFLQETLSVFRIFRKCLLKKHFQLKFKYFKIIKSVSSKNTSSVNSKLSKL